MDVNANHYFLVTGWMVTGLQLKGSELFIYAIIYGFSQDGASVYAGSADYLAKWTNTTRRNVMNCLSSLVAKGYILKKEEYKNDVKFVSYYANQDYLPTVMNFIPCEKSSQGGVKKVHTIINKDNKDIDIVLKEKESTKEKDSDIPYEEIVNHLNARTGSKYKSSSRKTRELIKARFNQGFTLEDFKTVIDKKSIQWINDPKMCEYLRPETLFSEKFEGYLNQIVRQKKKTLSEIDIEDMSDFMNFEEDV